MKNFLLLFTICAYTIVGHSQTVHTVDNRPESGAQFTSVQDAINDPSVLDGDILYIHPSPNSYGSINLTKSLTLVGPGHDPSNLGHRATLASITLRENTLNTVITGLNTGTISAYSYGANTGGVQILNNRITGSIDGYFNGSGTPNWLIQGNFFPGDYYSRQIDVRGSSDWSILNNVFEGFVDSANRTTVISNNLFINNDPSGNAVVFQGVNDITSPIVANNMFIVTDPDVPAVVSSGSTPVTFTNCLTYSTAGVTLPNLAGSGNLDNTNPQFSSIPTDLYDFYNNDYTLAGGSLALGAATDNGDIGIFGRNFPFDTKGRPASMPYPEVMTILNTVVQPGQNLNVEFQASQKN